MDLAAAQGLCAPLTKRQRAGFPSELGKVRTERILGLLFKRGAPERVRHVARRNSYVRNALETVSLVREAVLTPGRGGPSSWGPALRSPLSCAHSGASVPFTGVFWGIDGFSKGSSSRVSDSLTKHAERRRDVKFGLLLYINRSAPIALRLTFSGASQAWPRLGGLFSNLDEGVRAGQSGGQILLGLQNSMCPSSFPLR